MLAMGFNCAQISSQSDSKQLVSLTSAQQGQPGSLASNSELFHLSELKCLPFYPFERNVVQINPIQQSEEQQRKTETTNYNYSRQSEENDWGSSAFSNSPDSSASNSSTGRFEHTNQQAQSLYHQPAEHSPVGVSCI